MDSSPLISILIPAHNTAEFLRECLDSALAQQDVNTEIVVYDDGSTDQTAEILKSYGSRIRTCGEPVCRGVSHARNELIRQARGEWIAFLDSDDYFLPEKLRLQLDYIQAHPGCQALFCAVDNFYQDEAAAADPGAQRTFAVANRVMFPTALFARELFRGDDFNTALRDGEDTAFMVELGVRGVNLSHFLDQKLYRRRVRRGSLTVEKKTASAYLSAMAAMLRSSRKKQALQPLISVIIPVYNGEKYLREAVASVQSQTGDFQLEILLCDDGSTDNSREAAAGLDRVTWIPGPHTHAAEARNRGIRAAKGQFLLFLDADDRLLPEAVGKMLTLFRLNPSIEAVFSLSQDFHSPDLPEEQRRKLPLAPAPVPGRLPGSALLKRLLFEPDAIGLFDAGLKTGEAVDWLQRFRRSGRKAALLDLPTCERRIHDANTGRTQKLQELQDYARIIRKGLKRG